MLSAPEFAVVIALTVALVSGLVWAIRLEGRVNMAFNQIEQQKDAVEARQLEVTDRLVRIENKIDSLTVSTTAAATAAATAALLTVRTNLSSQS